MTHTPGPWARNISPKYPVYAESDHRKVALALNGHDMTDDEAMSNLRLIAAAPDLLETLATIADKADKLDAECGRDNMIHVMEVVGIAARAKLAIAKATGDNA